jgi:nucleotide-binding universal stress UspA family protein
VALAEALVRGSGEPVWLVHLTAAERPHQYLKDSATTQDSSAVDDLVAAAEERGLQHELISFASVDPAVDLQRVIQRKNARLLLLGTHRGTFGGESLRGVTGTLLRDCPSAVGILHHRGLAELRCVDADPSGPHGTAVQAMAAELRASGVEVDPPEGAEPDLKILGYSPDAGLPAHPQTSLLLLRGPAPAA